jgi:hypothetical protein
MCILSKRGRFSDPAEPVGARSGAWLAALHLLITAAPKTVAYPKTGALSRGSKVRQGHSGGLQPASQVAGHHLDLQATKDRFSQAIHTGSTLIVSTYF